MGPLGGLSAHRPQTPSVEGMLQLVFGFQNFSCKGVPGFAFLFRASYSGGSLEIVFGFRNSFFEGVLELVF